MKRWLREHALSLTMFGLFAVSFVGQGLAGWSHYNDEQREHGEAKVALSQYLASGDFIESVFENWESEFLQMAAFVLLSAKLIQKGSSQSRKPDEGQEIDAEPFERRHPEAPGPVHRGGLALKLYSHSLSLALTGLFVFSFALHGLGGVHKFNEEAAQHGDKPLSLLQYMLSSTFWFESLQNWQSEFLSVGVLIVLSIFLRERGSPESKPVHAPHAQTGD